MGHPMMNHPAHEGGHDWPRMFLIPIPMAMFGVLISFMFGFTVGHVMARKHAAMAGGGYPGPMGPGGPMGPMGLGGPMMWKHRMGMGGGMGMGPGMHVGGMHVGGWAMKKHHHHDDGPACCCADAPEQPSESAGTPADEAGKED